MKEEEAKESTKETNKKLIEKPLKHLKQQN